MRCIDNDQKVSRVRVFGATVSEKGNDESSSSLVKTPNVEEQTGSSIFGSGCSLLESQTHVRRAV